MLIPKRNNFDLFEDFFKDEDVFRKNSLMKTDILEKKDRYIIEMDLPGYSKENITLSLNGGYLEITAKMEKEHNEDDKKFVHRERFYGECSRNFYVGDDILEEDIEAEFKNGILKIDIPKKEEDNNKKENKRIEIK